MPAVSVIVPVRNEARSVEQTLRSLLTQDFPPTDYEVIVADSTSVLLYKLIRAAVGARPGRAEIIIESTNFPTDRFIVDGIAAECGLSVRQLDTPHDTGVRPADVASAVSERTAVVALTAMVEGQTVLAKARAVVRLS